MTSTVINLFGGPGCGKSTVASALFSHMKAAGLHCELVTEFIKRWLWEGRTIDELDYLFIMGSQARQESLLYGKVDYIITDSPILLSPVYEKLRFGHEIVLPSALRFVQAAAESGIQYRNFFLSRSGGYDQRGRYEDKSSALTADEAIREFLVVRRIPFTDIHNDQSSVRAARILKELELELCALTEQK